MGRPKGWVTERTGRAPIRSPGRPGVNQRDAKQAFWVRIAAGASSEDAALASGVSQPVISRRLTLNGGTPLGNHRNSHIHVSTKTGEVHAQAHLDATGCVRHYKSLAQVVWAFRSMKAVDLKVHPNRHRLADRVRAHSSLYMFAYHVAWLHREWVRMLPEKWWAVRWSPDPASTLDHGSCIRSSCGCTHFGLNRTDQGPDVAAGCVFSAGLRDSLRRPSFAQA